MHNCMHISRIINRYLKNNQLTEGTTQRPETAVLDVMSDVLMAADSGQVTLLGLLDQSAAFDVVDHDILMERLEHSFGPTGHVLAWIRSYLIGRSQCVSFNGERSTITHLICGLAQGSVLGPLYFLLYTAPILRIVEERGFNIHAYADDLQIYVHGDPLRSASMVNRLSDCVDVVKGWMTSNRLRLNPTKTEVTWLGVTLVSTTLPEISSAYIRCAYHSIFTG